VPSVCCPPQPDPTVSCPALVTCCAGMQSGTPCSCIDNNAGWHMVCRKRSLVDARSAEQMSLCRWYADVALSVGLQLAPPERLRFLIASDTAEAVAGFTEAVTATLRRDFPTAPGTLTSACL